MIFPQLFFHSFQTNHTGSNENIQKSLQNLTRKVSNDRMEVGRVERSLKIMKQFTKLEAIRELVKHDHSFLKPEFVEAITKPFGFKGSTYLAHANPEEIKGLSLYDDKGNPIDKAMGQDADVCACEIANHIGAKYQGMFGRGSALRECCRAVEATLK